MRVNKKLIFLCALGLFANFSTASIQQESTNFSQETSQRWSLCSFMSKIREKAVSMAGEKLMADSSTKDGLVYTPKSLTKGVMLGICFAPVIGSVANNFKPVVEEVVEGSISNYLRNDREIIDIQIPALKASWVEASENDNFFVRGIKKLSRGFNRRVPSRCCVEARGGNLKFSSGLETSKKSLNKRIEAEYERSASKRLELSSIEVDPETGSEYINLASMNDQQDEDPIRDWTFASTSELDKIGTNASLINFDVLD